MDVSDQEGGFGSHEDVYFDGVPDKGLALLVDKGILDGEVEGAGSS